MEGIILKKQNNGLIDIMNVFFILFFSVNYIITSFSDLIPYTYILVLQCLCCIHFFLIGNTRFKTIMFKYALLIIVLTLLFYFFTITSSVSITVSNYNFKRFLVKFHQLVNFFFPILLFDRFIKLKNRIFQVFILIIITGCFLYVIINSYFVFLNDTELSRNWESFSESETENVATYYFVYAAAALVPVLVAFQKKNKSLSVKFLTILGIILLYAFLFKAQYTMAILFPTLCIIYFELKFNKGSVKVFILIICLIAFLLLPYILTSVAELVTSEKIKLRLQALVEFMNNGENKDGPLNGRLELYKKCIEYFMYSPIIGNTTVPFDGHATFLTILCDLGIVGTIVTYYLYFGSRKEIRHLLNNKRKYNEWFSCFLCMVLIGFTNPIHPAGALAFVVYFMGPAFLILKNEKN